MIDILFHKITLLIFPLFVAWVWIVYELITAKNKKDIWKE